MKLINVPTDDLVVMGDLARSRTSKVFEERLRASIEGIGLAEPLKVALTPAGKYLVVDGMIRLRAVRSIREINPTAFRIVPAYVVDFGRRFEIRFQSDIYQDLLPSQLASLVEHLHTTENVTKAEIARYIGVSPATLRNYTGLWRLVQRGGWFARLVELMDVGVIPASTPYAWLRLTKEGLERVLRQFFTDGLEIEDWITLRIARAHRGDISPFPLQVVEMVTNSLPPECYQAGEEVRARKKELGRRKTTARPVQPWDAKHAIRHARYVSEASDDPVIQRAATSLVAYLQ
jgi:hypothetical protein